jgi:hypothetical protein
MNACSAGQPRDIRAIVHDDLRPDGRRHGDQLIGRGEKPGGRATLRPQLKQGRPAFEVRRSEIEQMPACTSGRIVVEDGVKARKIRG